MGRNQNIYYEYKCLIGDEDDIQLMNLTAGQVDQDGNVLPKAGALCPYLQSNDWMLRFVKILAREGDLNLQCIYNYLKVSGPLNFAGKQTFTHNHRRNKVFTEDLEVTIRRVTPPPCRRVPKCESPRQRMKRQFNIGRVHGEEPNGLYKKLRDDPSFSDNFGGTVPDQTPATVNEKYCPTCKTWTFFQERTFGFQCKTCKYKYYSKPVPKQKFRSGSLKRLNRRCDTLPSPPRHDPTVPALSRQEL